MPEHELESLLAAKFSVRHIRAAIAHHQKAVEEFQSVDWEAAIAKGGKFVEAVLKALWTHVGETVPQDRLFKAGKIMDGLANKPSIYDDTVRLTIPRVCRAIYDIASNRGARHDAGDVDPNQMDASLVVETSSWILAEMLRYSQKGSVDIALVADLVATLTERKFPFVEDVDGRSYFSLKGLSARDVVLLTLWRIHPRRMSKKELVEAAQRHGNSKANAAVAVSRVGEIVDDDGGGNLRLLMSGIREADALIASKRKG